MAITDPSDIPNLSFWVDLTDDTTCVNHTAGAVTSITDLAGTGRDNFNTNEGTGVRFGDNQYQGKDIITGSPGNLINQGNSSPTISTPLTVVIFCEWLSDIGGGDSTTMAIRPVTGSAALHIGPNGDNWWCRCGTSTSTDLTYTEQTPALVIVRATGDATSTVTVYEYDGSHVPGAARVSSTFETTAAYNTHRWELGGSDLNIMAFFEYNRIIDATEEGYIVDYITDLFNAAPPAVAPTWGTIPDQSDNETTLPQTLTDVSQYLTDPGEPDTVTYSVPDVTPPADITLQNSVDVVCGGAVTPGTYTVTVRASNGLDSDTTFDWVVTAAAVAPTWGTVPPQSDEISTLPQTLTDVSQYLIDPGSPDSVTYSVPTVSPPANITLQNSVDIVCGGDVTAGTYDVTVRASNGLDEDTSFEWSVWEAGSGLSAPGAQADRRNAALTITSDAATGRIYWAARTSGPYSNADADLIRRGTNSVWSGQAIADSGVNNLTAIGLEVDTTYHFGFVRDDGGLDGFVHDFNGTTGGFIFERHGTQYALDNNGHAKSVVEGVPAFQGCAYNDTTGRFEAHANFDGMLVTPVEISKLEPTKGLDGKWAASGIDLATVQAIGDSELTRAEYTTASPGSAYISRPALDSVRYGSLWVLTYFVQEGNTTGCTMEMDGSRGTAHFAWSGGQLSPDGVVDGATSDCYEVMNGLWAIQMRIPSATGAKEVRFYPAKKGDAVASGDYTWFMPGTLIEGDVLSCNIYPATGPTTSGIYQVPTCTAYSRLAALGVGDITSEFTIHVQFYVYNVQVAGGNYYYFALSNDDGDAINIGSTTNILRTSLFGATGSWSSTDAFESGVLMDLRMTYLQGADTWRASLTAGTGEIGTIQTKDGVAISTPLTDFQIGSVITQDRQPFPLVIKHLKIFNRAMTDQEMADLSTPPAPSYSNVETASDTTGVVLKPVTDESVSVNGSNATISWKGPRNPLTRNDTSLSNYLPFDNNDLWGVHSSGTPPTITSEITPRFGSQCSRHYTHNETDPGGERADQRSEWSDQAARFPALGTDMWWAVSFFIPSDQPIQDPVTGDVYTQIHGPTDIAEQNAMGKINSSWEDDDTEVTIRSNPTYDAEDENDTIETRILSPNWHNGQTYPGKGMGDIGRWHDVVVHMRLQPISGALTEYWFDGKLIVQSTLPNQYNGDLTGYAKFGIYNNQHLMAPGFSSLRYYDEWRIGVGSDLDYLDMNPAECSGFQVLDNADQVVATLSTVDESFDTGSLSAGDYTYKIRSYYDRDTSGSPTHFSTEVPVSFTIGDTAVPTWDTVPPQTYNKADLPDTLSMSQFIESNGGSPITSYRDVTPVANMPLNTSTGVYNINAAIAPGQHSLQTGATNATGEGLSAVWPLTINEAPSWDEPLPTQSNEQDDGGSYDLSLSLADTGYPTSVTYALVTPPTGFTLDADGKTVLCAPGTSVDSYTINVTADNGQVTATTLTWNVTEPMVAPTWDAPFDAQTDDASTLPQLYDVAGLLSGSPPPTLYLLGDSAGFSVSGTEISNDSSTPGVHTFTVRASNGIQPNAEQDLTWTTTKAPEWSEPLPAQSNQQDDGGSYDLALSLGDAGYPASVTYDLLTPPAGFSIAGSVVSCAPGTNINSYALTVTVDNGQVDTATLNWDVVETITAPTWDAPFAAQTDDESTLPQLYDVAGLFSGSPTPTVSLPTNPTGFSVSGTEISNDSSAPGIHTFAVRVSNGNLPDDDQDLTWTTTKAPEWSEPLPAQSNQQANGGSYNLALSLGDAGYPTSVTYDLLTPPAGFSIAGSVVSCAPGTDINSYALTVTVDNGQVDTATLNWDVVATYEAPDWTNTTVSRSDLASTQPHTQDCSDFSGVPPPALSLVTSVPGFRLDGTDLLAESGAVGEWVNVVRATNSEGIKDKTINWVLEEDPPEPSPPVGGYGDRKSFVGAVINWDAKRGWQNITNSGWSATGLPPGWTMSEDGFVTGTADTEGSWPGIVVTYNDGQAWDADPFQWDVLPAPDPSESSGSNTLAIAIRIGL